ncbi:BCL2/adenovirus E1B 19 kDa protein-interacting protein 3-like isoform X2 [Dinothrombium tinctorium]|uniref:BCL2/adenovirus E1B 19 kDa protein-interacting protein 3-like isoform X2 n=1 Tax=Dinothrombium tinctorium TaxID=1965070 RepID=A0A3S4RGG3_9ACAR|nr:BCL2/adenovirus E1B 19 kDa protein-interacting protein 3-like isoform X2 [Dinothrombium tinctorium]RWS16527.1 BCL2/adenovirus E1B 19 kDa protein-interacting protein 3-like isoform X2 [Dinothrombium tinctorium]
MEKLLRDAQKESNQSSAVCSGMNSHSISPVSPQSPVNISESISPVEALFMNKDEILQRSRQITTDWIWDWTLKSDSLLIRDWIAQEPTKKGKLNLRQWAVRRGIFSKEVLSLLLLTNFLSLILGAGIGYTVLVRRSM